MRRRIACAFYAATVAGITLTAVGFAGASTPGCRRGAAAEPAGRQHGAGRVRRDWAVVPVRFRHRDTSIPRSGSTGYGDMLVVLGSTAHPGSADAVIQVNPGGGPGSVGWGWESAGG